MRIGLARNVRRAAVVHRDAASLLGACTTHVGGVEQPLAQGRKLGYEGLALAAQPSRC
jgi:hypothetical protein